MKEAYVKFDTAKLLKEKGFDWDTDKVYERSLMACRYEDYPMPTQQMACKWLREEKGFYVYATYGCYPILNEEYWIPEIGSMMDFDVPDDFYKEYNSPEDAIEAALQYCLTKLIEQ